MARKLISLDKLQELEFQELRLNIDCTKDEPKRVYSLAKKELMDFCLRSFKGDTIAFQQSTIWILYQEFLKNTISNGPISGERVAKLYNTEVLVFGFSDNGTYFKDPSIKSLWESGQKIKSSKTGRFLNRGGGLQMILNDIFPYMAIDSLTGMFYASNSERLG